MSSRCRAHPSIQTRHGVGPSSGQKQRQPSFTRANKTEQANTSTRSKSPAVERTHFTPAWTNSNFKYMETKPEYPLKPLHGVTTILAAKVTSATLLPNYSSNVDTDDEETHDMNMAFNPDVNQFLLSEPNRGDLPSHTYSNEIASSSRRINALKTPHRKDVEAKARMKMRTAAQRLRNSISPRLDGNALRGIADVMEHASDLILLYQAQIKQLQQEVAQFHGPGREHH